MRRAFRIEIEQRDWSVDIVVSAAELIGETMVSIAPMPNISLLPVDTADPRETLKDALVRVIESL